MSAKYLYTVYKTTNLVNNKIYIGVHKTLDPNDDYLGSGKTLKKAVEKYGKENFTKKILYTYKYKKCAYKKENKLVNEEFINRNDTYNIVLGGNIGGSKKIYSKEKILKSFKKVHDNRYDYSLLEYIGDRYKIEIICKKHGPFWQKTNDHKNGLGCPKCASNHALSNDTAIQKFKKVHGTTYNYSLVNYKNAHTKVKIICRTHGVFEQTPNDHRKKHGCPKCNNRKLSFETILKRFKETHGNKYDYSLVKHVNVNDKVSIICKKHGVFKQTIKGHYKGYNCPKCSREK